MSNAGDRSIARQTLIVIGLVLATVIGLAFIWTTRLVLTWIVVAVFFAVALNPLVDAVQRRLLRRRAVATLVVFLATFVALCALGAIIVVPLLEDLTRFAEQAPDFLRDTRAGRGRLGALMQRLHLQQYAESHSEQLRGYLNRLGPTTLGLVRRTAEGVAGVLSVVVLAYLMSVQTPRITARTLTFAGEARAERLRRIGREISRTITGYLAGNLLISLICGVLTFIVLVLTGVPFAAVIALLVAIADLIPLVGATIGGVIAVGAALLHSTTSGLIVLVFYVVYQQAENHFLQPLIIGRTVRMSALTVLISVLLGANIAGLVGALLAIPAAGIVQVLLREFVLPLRRAGPSPEPGS